MGEGFFFPQLFAKREVKGATRSPLCEGMGTLKGDGRTLSGEEQSVAAAEGGGELGVASLTAEPGERAGGDGKRDPIVPDVIERRRGREEACDPAPDSGDSLLRLQGGEGADVQISKGLAQVLDGARLDHVTRHDQGALGGVALKEHAVESNGEPRLLSRAPLPLILWRVEVLKGRAASTQGEAQADSNAAPPAQGAEERAGRRDGSHLCLTQR